MNIGLTDNSSVTHDGTHCAHSSVVDIWMSVDLVCMMLHGGVGDRADALARISRRVIWWEDGRDCAHDRADALVHRLVLGRGDGFFEGGAGLGSLIGDD